MHLQIPFPRLGHRIMVEQTRHRQCRDIIERDNMQKGTGRTGQCIRTLKRRGKGHFAGGYQQNAFEFEHHVPLPETFTANAVTQVSGATHWEH
ncbi:hypothetical protein D3C76_1323290 [compost metagenome]